MPLFSYVSLVLSLMTGGVAPSPAAKAVAPPDPDTYTFVHDPDNDPRLEEFACGIRFGFRQVLGRAEGGRYAELRRTGPDSAEFVTFVGGYDFSVGKGMTHQLTVATTRDDRQCAVAFRFLSATPFKRGRILNLWKEPSGTGADALAHSVKFLYRPSFESAYPAAAIMANFERLAVRGCNSVGYAAKSEIPDEHRSDRQPVYCVKVGAEYLPVIPECVPYRDGSKCTVLAALTADRDKNTFDARAAAAQFRGAIRTIIED